MNAVGSDYWLIQDRLVYISYISNMLIIVKYLQTKWSVYFVSKSNEKFESLG